MTPLYHSVMARWSGRGVLGFDDGAHGDVAIALRRAAHDAAVGAGVVAGVHRQQRDLVLAAQRDQAPHGLGAHQRHVAVQDQRQAIVRQQRRRLLHGVAGAQLRFLAHRLRRNFSAISAASACPVSAERFNFRSAVAGDHNRRARAQRGRTVEYVRQQGPPGQPVQHLRDPALHARALARGHDDDVDCAH
jgi:hypothetical protein